MIHMGTKTVGSNSVYKRIVESLSTIEWISFQEKIEICSWARAEKKEAQWITFEAHMPNLCWRPHRAPPTQLRTSPATLKQTKGNHRNMIRTLCGQWWAGENSLDIKWGLNKMGFAWAFSWEREREREELKAWKPRSGSLILLALVWRKSLQTCDNCGRGNASLVPKIMWSNNCFLSSRFSSYSTCHHLIEEDLQTCLRFQMFEMEMWSKDFFWDCCCHKRYICTKYMMMMMMTPGKFKVLKQPILSIGFFRFVIMDDDELTHLEHIVKNEIREPHCFVCHIRKEDLHSLDWRWQQELRYAGQIALGKKIVQASRHETHPWAGNHHFLHKIWIHLCHPECHHTTIAGSHQLYLVLNTD